jgi:shikimate dehydrogenase
MTDFGLIGHPVSHSMSKIMHEAAFDKLGLDYTYGLFDTQEHELKLFMDNAKFRGLNVTIPLKVAVLDFLDELSEEAKLIGSVNTIEFIEDKKVGHNTDVLGFMKCLEEAEVDVLDMTFLVLGVGGAGRGIVYKLAMEKARVYVFDVDQRKCKALAEEVLKKVGVRVEPIILDEIEQKMHNVDVLVNATPVGMHPNVDKIPIPSKLMHQALTVVDIVYNPVETKLLKEAGERGCKTVNGVGMLVHQGAEAQKIWLDNKPPIDVMKEAVLKNLTPEG